ncbi:MAG TPA: Ig-like domain-containing protein [Verrucomicrobiae bacterium]|jgi:plastocyanin
MKRFKYSSPVLTLLAGAACVLIGTNPACADTFTVDIVDYAYAPDPVTIHVDDTVNWVWASDYHSTTSEDGLWDSDVNNTGYSYSHTFTSIGTFNYYCTVHYFYGQIDVVGAVAPPTVAITTPTNGSVFLAPATIDIAAGATNSDGTAPSVQFFEGSTPLVTDTQAPYGTTASNLAAGSYTFSAVATDANNRTATNSVTIEVVNPTNVTVSITSPGSGMVLSDPATLALSASASSSIGTVTNVQYFSNDVAIGSATVAPFLLTVSNLAFGQYNLTAVATAEGAAGTSAPVGVFVADPLLTTNAPAVISSLPNFVITTPPTVQMPSGFIFDINGGVSGLGPISANSNNSPNFSINAGATYVFSMLGSSAHPVDISTTATTSNLYSGASAQMVTSDSPNTTVTLTIPPTNYPPTLYYICAVHKFYGVITVLPPVAPPSALIAQTTVSSNIVLTFSGGTNTIQLIPQYSSNLVDWLAVPGYTNSYPGNGTNFTTFDRLDDICGPSVFLRIAQAPN